MAEERSHSRPPPRRVTAHHRPDEAPKRAPKEAAKEASKQAPEEAAKDAAEAIEPAEQPDRLAAPVDAEQPPRLPFPVVGVGASAGGLEAFSEFLHAMRADSGMAIVLIQHLPPDRESL